MNQQDGEYFQTWFSFLAQQQNQIIKQLGQLQQGQQILTQGEQKMALDISKLQAAVAAETAADQSAITLLAQLTQEVQQIAANSADPATVQALSDLATQIQTNAQSLAAAVVANTPAAPTTTVAPASP